MSPVCTPTTLSQTEAGSFLWDLTEFPGLFNKWVIFGSGERDSDLAQHDFSGKYD